MITLTWVYVIAGVAFAAFAVFNLIDKANPRRFGNAAFWGLMAVSMWAGDLLGDFGNGLRQKGFGTGAAPEILRSGARPVGAAKPDPIVRWPRG